MKNSLAAAGLSLVQAMAISNLLNQKASDLVAMLGGLNNSKKVLLFENRELVVQAPKAVPSDVVNILLEVAKLRGVQAFLMENVKAKDVLLKDIREREFTFSEEKPDAKPYLPESGTVLYPFTEKEAWDTLSLSEGAEYLEQEALAAHIGQFIHKGMPLDQLRKELDTISPVEWTVIGKNTPAAKELPVTVEVHHTKEQLLDLHNELAGIHREAEQRVNYYKAKVKNLTSEENARRSKENAVEQARVNTLNSRKREEYQALIAAWDGRKQEALALFEQQRELDTNSTAALRISVDARFQPVVDEYLAILEPTKASE